MFVATLMVGSATGLRRSFWFGAVFVGFLVRVCGSVLSFLGGPLSACRHLPARCEQQPRQQKGFRVSGLGFRVSGLRSPSRYGGPTRKAPAPAAKDEDEAFLICVILTVRLFV